MKAVFCDIDGVLNHQHDKAADYSWTERFGLARDLVDNLKEVLSAVPDAQLVISSSWRAFHDNMGVPDIEGDWHDALAGMLGVPRDRMSDAPTLHEFGPASETGANGENGANGRAYDILLWLSDNGEGDRYAVIDDECTVLRTWFGDAVVDCADKSPGGLTAERAKRAIRILTGGIR